METLAAWLKQIILVILIATFADLLLPNRSMQRYVKLVISLFILVTILSPIMNLLGSGTNLRTLAASVEGWSLGGALDDAIPPEFIDDSATSKDAIRPPNGGTVPALSNVLSAGEELAAKRNAESLELLKAKLESMVKEQIELQHGVNVVRLDTRLSLDEGGKPVIEKLDADILLEPPKQEDLDNPIGQVEPVDIRIQVGDKPNDSMLAFNAEATLSKEAAAKKQEVTEALSKQWEVDRRRITVTVKEERDARR